jgi:hypothetical protein
LIVAGRGRYTRRVSIPTKPPFRPGAAPPPANEDALGRSRRDKDELQIEVHKIEEELEALKARYEQYFLGIERREPVRLRDELKKRVLLVKGAFTRNAALRFRIQTLHARYLSYERLWLRSAREREEGTYRRDLFKARLRSTAPEPTAPEPAPADAGVLAARTPAPPGRPSAPPAPPAGGVDEVELRAIYDAYVSAKRQCNEDVSKLTYETVAKTVSRQVPELMAKYKARSVEFKVEVKDGRAVLKAIPKA